MELISTKVCKKGDIGVHNNLFGGCLLSWVDEDGTAIPIAKHVRLRYEEDYESKQTKTA